jgi:hypothetical protein
VLLLFTEKQQAAMRRQAHCVGRGLQIEIICRGEVKFL